MLYLSHKCCPPANVLASLSMLPCSPDSSWLWGIGVDPALAWGRPWQCKGRMTSSPGILPDDHWLLFIQPSTGLAQRMPTLCTCDAISLSVTQSLESSSAVIKWPGITTCWSWYPNLKSLSILQRDAVTTMINVGNTEKPNICEPLLVSKNMSTDSVSVSPFSRSSLAQTPWGLPNQSCFLYLWASPISSLEQGLAKFLCRGPDSKYLRLHRPQVSVSTAEFSYYGTETALEDT